MTDATRTDDRRGDSACIDAGMPDAARFDDRMADAARIHDRMADAPLIHDGVTGAARIDNDRADARPTDEDRAIVAAIRDRVTGAAPTPEQDARRAPGEQAHAWQAVDLALRTIAQRRAALDAEEARWLRDAEALEIWRPLGMVSVLDYMERALGYSPRTAHERLRVARALGRLPKLTAALAGGELGYSAVRELSRVATGATEQAWCERALGKNLREIEELVAEHSPGDLPDDPKDPSVRRRVVRLELSAETFALFRQARQVLDREHGTSLSEDELIAQLCDTVLDGGKTTAAPTGRAKFQVAVTLCQRCKQGWQHGAGAKIAIGPAAVERALCDAQHLGSIDSATPARAYQDVSPSVARFVWHRDGGRCRVPGCRSSRGLEIHHLIHRADGGTHEPAGLILACSACHLAHHAGTLTITGTADHVEVIRPARAHAGSRGTAGGRGRDDRPLVPHQADAQGVAGAAEQPADQSDDRHQAHTHADSLAASNVPRNDSLLVHTSDASAGAEPAEQLVDVEPTHTDDGPLAPGLLPHDGSHLAQHARGSEITGAAGRLEGIRPARERGVADGSTAGDHGTRTRTLLANAWRLEDIRPASESRGADGSTIGDHGIGPGTLLANTGPHVGSHPASRASLAGPPSKLDLAEMCAEAKVALKQLGWPPTIAQAAVRAAATTLGAEATLERLLAEALRRCPQPPGTTFTIRCADALR